MEKNVNSGKKFSGVIKDKNGAFCYFEDGVLTEKNFYPSKYNFIVESGEFDEKGELIKGEIKYFRYENEDFDSEILEKQIFVDKTDIDNIKNESKIKVEEIVEDKKEEIKIEKIEKEEIFEFSDEEKEIFTSLSKMQKEEILNEIHIEITKFVREKQKIPGAKEVRELYNIFKTDEKTFEKFYKLGTEGLKKVGIKKDFLEKYRKDIFKGDFLKEKNFEEKYILKLEEEIKEISEKIFNNMDFYYDEIIEEFRQNKKQKKFLQNIFSNNTEINFTNQINFFIEKIKDNLKKITNGSFYLTGKFYENVKYLKNYLKENKIFSFLEKIEINDFFYEKIFFEKVQEHYSLTSN